MKYIYLHYKNRSMTNQEMWCNFTNIICVDIIQILKHPGIIVFFFLYLFYLYITIGTLKFIIIPILVRLRMRHRKPKIKTFKNKVNILVESRSWWISTRILCKNHCDFQNLWCTFNENNKNKFFQCVRVSLNR